MPKAKTAKPTDSKASSRQTQSSAKLARLLRGSTQSNTLSAADLRHNSAEILSRVALGGERLVITRNRKAVAALVPLSDYESLKKSATGAYSRAAPESRAKRP